MTAKQFQLKVNRTLESRQEMIGSQAHTVYPVIMIREGVHNGVLYTQAELDKFHTTWNGSPVPIYHPDSEHGPVSCNSPDIYESQVVGTVFNTRMDGDSLKAELWIDQSRLNALDPELRDLLNNGAQIDVSTGLFCEEIFQQGVWEGEPYESIAYNIRPDHLAILPGQTGACSWADGCGIRSNKKTKSKGGKMKRGDKKAPDLKVNAETFEDLKAMKENGTLPEYLIPVIYSLDREGFTINEAEYTGLVQKARELVDSMDNEEGVYFLRKMYPDNIIYRANYRSGKDKLFKRNYTQGTDGNLSWNGDPTEVVENTSYSVVTQANKANNKTTTKEEPKMTLKTMKECCPDKVDDLIKNNDNFTDENRDTLLGMSEEAFALTINAAKPIENKVKAPVTEEVKNLTFEEILTNASPEVQESIQYGQKALNDKKQELITSIKANEANKFSDEELAKFNIDMLEKLSGSFPAPKTPAPPTFMGNNGGVPTIVDNGEDSGPPLGLPDYSEKSE